VTLRPLQEAEVSRTPPS